MSNSPIVTNNVLVTNLDNSVSVDSLTKFFSFTGNVVQVRLSDGPDGTKQAIIEFDTPESVKTAELMTGATLENRRIVIVPTELTQSTMHDDVFVGENLPERTIPEIPVEHTQTSVVASLLASGYILADNTFQKAVSIDKENGITDKIKQGANVVKDTLVGVDESLHFTEYLALGATVALSYAESINEKYQVTQTISEKAQLVDQSLGVTEKVGIAKQKVGESFNNLATSQPVQNLSHKVNDFKQEIQQDIAIKKSEKDFIYDTKEEIVQTSEVKEENLKEEKPTETKEEKSNETKEENQSDKVDENIVVLDD
ncbi:RNA-binding protein [Entamoeba marina]